MWVALPGYQLLEPYGQSDADEQQRVGQTSMREAGGIENLRANGSGALLSHGMVCGHRAAMQHLMPAVLAAYEASASMHRMGPAPGQQEARAGEASGGEKQGVAYGRPLAGARKPRGTRGRAVPARACAENAHVTASFGSLHVTCNNNNNKMQPATTRTSSKPLVTVEGHPRP